MAFTCTGKYNQIYCNSIINDFYEKRIALKSKRKTKKIWNFRNSHLEEAVLKAFSLSLNSPENSCDGSLDFQL